MREISEVSSEEEAMALLGDPVNQGIVGDPQRLAQTMQSITQTFPGHDSIPVYDEAGERVLYSFRKGEEVTEQILNRAGFHSSPEQMFFADDLDDDEDIAQLIGNFRNKREAAKVNKNGNLKGQFAILNQAQHSIASQAATIRAGNRRADVDLLMKQDRFAIDQGKGYTAFANLIYEHENGLIDDKLFEAAWKRLTFTSGLTPEDLAVEYREDASENYANVENMSVLFNQMVQSVIANPLIITNVSAIPKIAAKIGAELGALAALSGMTHKPIDEYDWGSLASESNVLKGMFLDAAVVSARADGQTARSLSDRDLQLFLDRVGRDISDVPSFVKNLDNLAKRHQREFFTRYRAFTKQEWDGAGFTQIKFTESEINEQFKQKLTDEYGVTFKDKLGD